MHKKSKSILFATFAIVLGSVSAATAQSQAPAVNATADVVKAEGKAPSRVVLEKGCAPGYWRLDSLCFDSATGDVERVDEKRWPDGNSAEGRK